MTCSATLRHNAGEAWAASIGKPLASKRLERWRPELCALRAAERSMRAHGRGKRRGLLLARALGAAAATSRRKPRLGRRRRRPTPIMAANPAPVAGSAGKLRRHRRRQPVDRGVQRRARAPGRRPEPQPVRASRSSTSLSRPPRRATEPIRQKARRRRQAALPHRRRPRLRHRQRGRTANLQRRPRTRPAVAHADRAPGGDGAARRRARSAESARRRRLARRAGGDRVLLRRARLRAGMGRR